MKIHETLLQWQVPLWANAECKNLTWTVGAFLQSQRTELAADDTNSNTSPRVNQGLLSACDFSKTGHAHAHACRHVDLLNTRTASRFSDFDIPLGSDRSASFLSASFLHGAVAQLIRIESVVNAATQAYVC